MTDYFEVAKTIIRSHEEKRKVPPCECGLYKFPHRRSARCEDHEADMKDMLAEMDSREKVDAEELACFNRVEARAINSGAI